MHVLRTRHHPSRCEHRQRRRRHSDAACRRLMASDTTAGVGGCMHERPREVVGGGACGVLGMRVHRVEVAPVSWQADRAEPRVVLKERGCRVASCAQRCACMRAWFVAALSTGAGGACAADCFTSATGKRGKSQGSGGGITCLTGAASVDQLLCRSWGRLGDGKGRRAGLCGVAGQAAEGPRHAPQRGRTDGRRRTPVCTLSQH